MKLYHYCQLLLGAAAGCAGGMAEAGTISPELAQEMARHASGDRIPVIIQLNDRVNMLAFELKDRRYRDTGLMRALKAQSALSLPRLSALLDQSGAGGRKALWINNAIAITVPVRAIDALARHSAVYRIQYDAVVTFSAPAARAAASPGVTGWNIDAIQAPAVWSLGALGAGVVVANMDTGVDLAHPDLRTSWRGGNNSWFDPNQQHPSPYDAHGHGTQTMGLIVGGAASGAAIGVAPKATWVAAKIFNDAGQATLSNIHLVFQWLMDPDGDPATVDAPDVVNASWSLIGGAPGACNMEFNEDIQALSTAGIVVVFAAGNNGPAPASAASPAANPAGFSVGAFAGARGLWRQSSRGPSGCDGSVFPNLVAPGQNVVSSDLSFGGLPRFAMVSGTSFAAPHVSGALALLASAFPAATVSQLKNAVMDSAKDLDSAGPDNNTGFGLLNTLAAYHLLAIGNGGQNTAQAVRIAATPFDAGSESQRMAGQAIYRDGLLASGKPLAGIGSAGVLRLGRDAACVACHRRSGFGIAEGQVVVRPITAPDLFQTRVVEAATPRIAHQLGTPRRPAYDAATLATALRSGIDVAGHSMNSMMPRYALGDADMAALQVYLKSLYAHPDPGVSAQEIRLATVIQPKVVPEQRKAMLDVLRAFVHDKNAGVRSEVARRKGGAMRIQRSYRRWVLDVWELAGAPEGWGAQLEEHYRRRPVFALVSGIGDLSWQPVHDFSERLQVPCILPLNSIPGTATSNFYTVYFSRGIALEAEALASYLGAQAGTRNVTQVFRSDQPASLAAANAFRATLPSAVRLEERALGARMSAAQWRTLAGTDAVLVLWLGVRDLPDLPAHSLERGRPTWMSATLLDGAMPMPHLGMTYPWEMPELRASRVRRSTDWLRAKDIGGDQLQVQVNTYFAIAMVGEALSHLMDSFSRDYFVETIEHNLTTTLLSSFYPPLTLGPDQRHASKGVYLVRSPGPGALPVPVAELVVP